jgi:hypothetical protein
MDNNIFCNLGYDIIKQIDIDKINLNENNELNELFNKEKFQIENIKEYIDYDLNHINNIIRDDNNNVIDIEYENTDKNTSYLEAYLTNDYIGLMNWYMKEYKHLPYIENLSYFLVKKDLTGRCKLDKYEKVILKKELKKQRRAEEIIEMERTKYIKKLEREKKQPINKLSFRKQNIKLSF